MSFVFEKSKYKHLIANDILVASSKISDESDIPNLTDGIPEKYRKSFTHPENGFVRQYCQVYKVAWKETGRYILIRKRCK
mgnify:CR=1 FL=1